MANLDPTKAFNSEEVKLDSDALLLEESEARLSMAFKRHAERDTKTAQMNVLNGLAQLMRFLEEREPDLSEAERLVLSKRILKQRLVIYMGQLDQLF